MAENAYAEYLLLHSDAESRDLRRDAKALLVTSVLCLAVLATAGAAFDIFNVDGVKRYVDDSSSPTTKNTTAPPTTNTTASPSSGVTPERKTTSEKFDLFLLKRCLTPAGGSESCEYFWNFEKISCRLVEDMVLAISVSGIAAALTCLTIFFTAVHTIRGGGRGTVTCQWVLHSFLVLTTVGAAVCVVVLVAADGALCWAGYDGPASSKDGFSFGVSFWLLVVASPVLAITSLAFSMRSC